MKKTNHHTTMGMALGMCLGVSFGTSLGMVFDNTSLGISLGLSIGLALGLALGSLKDKEVNKQLEEKGYVIKSITENKENDEYASPLLTNLAWKTLSLLLPDKWMKKTLK